MSNMFSLEGKIALVTGASYGIGFAIACAMSDAGATIVFNDIKQELVDKGIAAYAAFVGSVSTVRWDKSVMDSMTALASDIAQNVPTYKMGCLPNAEAAEICCREVEKQ